MASDALWVVAACFNEETVVTRFIDQVMVLPEVNRLLLIDDGSSDGTVLVIRRWQRDNPTSSVTLLELTRNFGKEAAMLAGFGLCRRAMFRRGFNRLRPPAPSGTDSRDGAGLARGC